MLSEPRILSLFSGYGGLDMAVTSVIGGTVVAHSEIDADASRLLAHHWPDIPNVGDITTADLTELGRVDVVTGGFPCFAAGTPVLTRRGLVPIEAVVTGDEVWTHEARWKNVTATMQREAETVEFRPGFYCTPKHRLWLREPSKVWRNDIRQYRRALAAPEWTEARDSKGYFAATPVAVADVPHEKPEELSWWQVGRWLADGFCAPGSVNVCVGYQKASDLKRFRGWTITEQPTAMRLRLPRSTAASAWLVEHFGKGAVGKTVPAFVLSLPEADRREVLDGYWSGDGYAFQARSTRSASVSSCLTIGIQMLAASLGYTTSLHYNRTADTTVIEGRVVSQRDWWSVTATPDDGRYAERDSAWLWQKNRREPADAGVRTVYDLTVADDHSFVAAGIVVHNCQDLSIAGKQIGLIRYGSGRTRSGLWALMAQAIDKLRPRLAVIENVRGLLSAPADSNVESCPWCVGDERGGAPVPLRALGAVLGDLADIGYDAAWYGLSASDVGACHARFRVFVIAWPADAAGDSWRVRDGDGHRPRPEPRGGAAAEVVMLPTPCASSHTQNRSKSPGASVRPTLHAIEKLLPTPRTTDTTGPGAHGQGGLDLRTAVTLLPTPRASDGEKGGPNQRGSSGDLTMPSVAPRLLPTPSVADTTGGRRSRSGDRSDELLLNGIAHYGRFGEYTQAIARAEAAAGRAAPPPTVPRGRGGAHRLSAEFVEWMMLLPPGHVTSVPGLSVSAQLRMLGNGVVPAQAATALRHMLTVTALGVAS